MERYQEIIEEGILADLINKHDDPYQFAADVLKQLASGKLKLKTRGASNTRELIALFYKSKSKNKSMINNSVQLKSFKTHITEANKINSFMTHSEDAMYFDGYVGFKSSLCLMSNVVDTLSGSSSSRTNITTKWDGSPAVVLGINPENGKFFVSTKAIFNKTPKINYTDADIRTNHKGALVDILSIVLKYGPKLGIKSGIFQGDLMFTPEIKKKQKMDGEPHWVFQPNTIAYAVPTDSDIGKTIGAAKIGIVFHTEYKGTIGNLSADFNISLGSRMKKTKDVFWTDAYFNDVSGTATFTAAESKELKADIRAIEKDGRTVRSIMDTISKNSGVNAAITQYTNANVRAGNITVTTSELLNFVATTMKVSDGRKQSISEFVHSYKYEIDKLFALHGRIGQVKIKIIRKLETVKNMKQFLKRGDEYVVTAPEGFVVLDHVGNALKLVDRINFSRANFCKPN